VGIRRRGRGGAARSLGKGEPNLMFSVPPMGMNSHGAVILTKPCQKQKVRGIRKGQEAFAYQLTSNSPNPGHDLWNKHLEGSFCGPLGPIYDARKKQRASRDLVTKRKVARDGERGGVGLQHSGRGQVRRGRLVRESLI